MSIKYYKLFLNLFRKRTYSKYFGDNTTIFSVCSGKGKCGVSIIRVSGPQVSNVLEKCLSNPKKITSRFTHLRKIYHPATREIIDRGIVVLFPKPFSFTGEDICEFHVHGSQAVILALLNGLGSIDNVRSAEPGEFTKRAFLNGKLDLTEVEGLADLIHAETEMQRKQAFFQSTGLLSKRYNNWRTRLIKLLAYLEAYIDFAEEEIIDDWLLQKLVVDLRYIQQEIEDHLKDKRKGELLRDGIRTAIIGAPNVGKSSFLNLICQRRLAIVSPHPGTTRDVIESVQDISGYPIIFNDTAGLREYTTDPIETEGIRLTQETISSANIILHIVDANTLDKTLFSNLILLESYIKKLVYSMNLSENVENEKKVKIIINKIDLLSNDELLKLRTIKEIILISCKYKTNFDQFLTIFHDTLKELCGEPQMENPRITNQRHRQQLLKCNDIITKFLKQYGTFEKEEDMAVAALHLRNGIKCIENITGKVKADDILNVIFKDFCIGK